MASLTHTTTDHDEIRRWVEQHDGVPATVRNTGDDPGRLRIDFPAGAGSERLQDIDGDSWFEELDDADLAVVYQEHTASGADSTFIELVRR
jgi:hypothetical protein